MGRGTGRHAEAHSAGTCEEPGTTDQARQLVKGKGGGVDKEEVSWGAT